MATCFKMFGIKVHSFRGIFQLVLYIVRHTEKFSEKYFVGKYLKNVVIKFVKSE